MPKEKEEFKTANVALCIKKIKELVEELPEKEGETLTWDDKLVLKKQMAEKAIQHLETLFVGEPDDVPLGRCTILSIDPPGQTC